MIILILALLFGVAVAAFLITSLGWAKKNGKSSKLIVFIKLAVLLETVIYLGLFIFVFIRTMSM